MLQQLLEEVLIRRECEVLHFVSDADLAIILSDNSLPTKSKILTLSAFEPRYRMKKRYRAWPCRGFMVVEVSILLCQTWLGDVGRYNLHPRNAVGNAARGCSVLPRTIDFSDAYGYQGLCHRNFLDHPTGCLNTHSL